jgi:hypothetical protein
MSGCSSFSHASTTEANASLISMRSMSSIVMPARSSTLCVAGIGAVSMRRGSAPASAKFTKRARGVRPSCRGLLLAHDERGGAVGDLRRVARGDPAALLLGAERRLQLRERLHRRLADALVGGHHLASAPSTGRISRSKRPSAVARAANCWLRAPKASMSSRVMPHLSAISSAEMPWGTRPPWSA